MDSANIRKTEDLLRNEGRMLLPAVDVVEDTQGITLYADLPGVPKENLNVRVEDNTLFIEGKVNLPTASNLEASHAEVDLPRYQRSFLLGQELDCEKVGAEFKHGVLKLHIPKAEHAKPRKIEVNVA